MEMDLKLALATVEQIIDENADNKEIIDACQIAVAEIKEGMKVHCSNEESKSTNLEVTELFGLYRTRIIIMLLRDVNRFGNNKIEIERGMTTILDIVEGKISKLQERKEENKNEKNIRR